MDAAPIDLGHLPDCVGVVLHSCNEFLVMSKPKPRGCEVDGGECVSLGVAERIPWVYRRGFERADDEGGAGIGCVVGELGAEFVVVLDRAWVNS